MVFESLKVFIRAQNFSEKWLWGGGALPPSPPPCSPLGSVLGLLDKWYLTGWEDFLSECLKKIKNILSFSPLISRLNQKIFMSKCFHSIIRSNIRSNNWYPVLISRIFGKIKIHFNPTSEKFV